MSEARSPFPLSLSGRHLGSTDAYVAQVRAASVGPVTRESAVSLRAITRDTLRAVALLDVAENQYGLVAPNAYSIAQASFHPEAWFRAIYADDTPVGFAMLEDWSQVKDREPDLYQGAPYVSLWRFMIDERFQRFGFGSRALQMLIGEARARPGVRQMLLSFVPEGPNAEAFYARHGFVRTGEMDQGEVVMKLEWSGDAT